jgi:hypothetical protein
VWKDNIGGCRDNIGGCWDNIKGGGNEWKDNTRECTVEITLKEEERSEKTTLEGLETILI